MPKVDISARIRNRKKITVPRGWNHGKKHLFRKLINSTIGEFLDLIKKYKKMKDSKDFSVLSQDQITDMIDVATFFIRKQFNATGVEPDDLIDYYCQKGKVY